MFSCVNIFTVEIKYISTALSDMKPLPRAKKINIKRRAAISDKIRYKQLLSAFFVTFSAGPTSISNFKSLKFTTVIDRKLIWVKSWSEILLGFCSLGHNICFFAAVSPVWQILDLGRKETDNCVRCSPTFLLDVCGLKCIPWHDFKVYMKGCWQNKIYARMNSVCCGALLK